MRSWWSTVLRLRDPAIDYRPYCKCNLGSRRRRKSHPECDSGREDSRRLATHKFVDAYNELMTLIGDLLAEQKKSTTGDDKDAVFGLLHGDPLLWSIQSQMRSLIMNPVSNVASAVASNKFVNSAAALDMTGSFYVTSGGKRTRIDVAKTDSLEDIRRTIAEATNQLTKDGKAIADDAMPISVAIRDGQLVINSTSSKIGLTTQTHTIKRAKGQDYDYLPFAYEKKPPFDGKLSVTSAGKVYTEGVDFEIVTKQDEGSKLSKAASSGPEPIGPKTMKCLMWIIRTNKMPSAFPKSSFRAGIAIRN